MKLYTGSTRSEIAVQAASDGATLIRSAIESRGEAAIVLATGASQIEMLAALSEEPGVGWNSVTCFHLDEYIGLPITHPASFRLFLWDRFMRRLPLPPKVFHFIDGNALRPEAECRRMGELIRRQPIDVAFLGIGENGHLAFNDPPADFDTEAPYLVVELDDACRRQQLGEGWFPTLEEVPRTAISMSCRQILRAQHIVCTVPDLRKAAAVSKAVEGPVDPMTPASILQEHSQATIYLDPASSSRLREAR